MRTLVIIPSLMHKYSFSAPLAWLFSDHIEQVKGIYSFELNKAIVEEHDSFIVELNWFIELLEFDLIARFIKRHNRKAVILFGGLYSQLKYQEIFAHSPVDYFIKGDAELPVKQFLDGIDPHKIPNMVGRDFENEQSYVFRQDEFRSLEFNLDWLPDYFTYLEKTAPPDDNVEPNFDDMPFFPRYLEKAGQNISPERRWRVPSRGGRYYLPMLITSRGECTVAHAGCEYCMGSKSDVLCEIYKRPGLVMDNDTLLYHLHKIEKKFDRVSIFINSDFNYDFNGHYFDLEATIEIDSINTPEDVAKILPAFRRAVVHLAIYRDCLTGKDVRDKSDFNAYQSLEDEHHKIYFFAFDEDLRNTPIPKERRLYSDLLFPPWADWKFYNIRANALAKSREWYFATGQTNLYPLPRQIIIRFIRFFVLRIFYVLNKLKIINMKKRFL